MRYNIYVDGKPVDIATDRDVAISKYKGYVKDMEAGYSKKVSLMLQRDSWSLKEELVESVER